MSTPPARTACLLLATGIAALLFAPVFGVRALLLPVGVPVAVMFLCTLACGRRSGLRPLLLALAGVLAVAETTLWSTTVAGLPTGQTVRALADGITDSWQLTLQSTWPARPDPALLLFVPLLTVLAGVVGVELLHRLASPLPALAPSLAVAVLSQLYAPLPAAPAALAALGYAAAAGGVLADRARHTGAAATATVVALVAALLIPIGPARYSLRWNRPAPLAETVVASPLDEIASRLARPGLEVFRIQGATGVDRWPVVVLDAFDGVNWTSADQYRRMGIDLRPGPAVTVPVRTRSARIDLADGEGPWLPSQTWPARVDGVAPLVEERHGTLLLPGARGPASYTLTWWQPEVDAAALGAAAIDPDLPGGLGSVGSPPPGVTELASQAVRGVRPSFQAALALERYLRDNYRVAVGDDLPTGHAWPQLADFLLRDKRGTSEQFAAAYVALARMLSIPTRLVVGFRAPAGPDGYTVRNGDVLAWPEVAVAGVGWVPLDPSGTATASSAPSGGGLAAVTARARAQLPAPEDLRDPPVTAPRPATPRGGGVAVPWTAVLSVAAALAGLSLVGWLVGVPAAKTARAWRRRRRPGAGAVVGAWEEARDRLREHGVPVSGAMTVRDLATAAAPLTDQSTVEGLRRLSSAVDRALWSSSTMDGTDRVEAWAAVRAVRRGLASRGWLARLRARLHPRTLRRPG